MELFFFYVLLCTLPPLLFYHSHSRTSLPAVSTPPSLASRTIDASLRLVTFSSLPFTYLHDLFHFFPDQMS